MEPCERVAVWLRVQRGPRQRAGCRQSAHTPGEPGSVWDQRVGSGGPRRAGSLPSPSIKTSAAETPWTGPSDRRAHAHPLEAGSPSSRCQGPVVCGGPSPASSCPLLCPLATEGVCLPQGLRHLCRGQECCHIRSRGGATGTRTAALPDTPFLPSLPSSASESWRHQRHLPRSCGS